MNPNNAWRNEPRNYMVYKMVCGDDSYIGITSNDLETRMDAHFTKARCKGGSTLDLHKKMLETNEYDWTIEALASFTGTYYEVREKETEYKLEHKPTLNMTSTAHFDK